MVCSLTYAYFEYLNLLICYKSVQLQFAYKMEEETKASSEVPVVKSSEEIVDPIKVYTSLPLNSEIKNAFRNSI